jgi:RimJ/RimL family protein N-acetyltransferase
MPFILETNRLMIRPFEMADLADIHRILDVELGEVDFGSEGAQSLGDRRHWLEWSMLNYGVLEQLRQPPYGDRAVTLKDSGELVGAVGYVPLLAPFGQLPYFQRHNAGRVEPLAVSEVGLFYAVSPHYQRKGYAREAAFALVNHAFTTLRLKRILATTTYENEASMAVMRRLGMRVERNPLPYPPWFQVVGILENPDGQGEID